MKKTRNLLMTLFAGFLALAGLLYVAGEFLHYDYSFLAHTSRQTQFICSTVMILLTICLVPLSLRLFKFRRINADLLQRKADALAFWGSLRMVSLGLLLVVNTFLYFCLQGSIPLRLPGCRHPADDALCPSYAEPLRG